MLSALLVLCEGKPTGIGGSPHKMPEIQNFSVFYANLYALLNKSSNYRWSETPWPTCDVMVMYNIFLELKALFQFSYIFVMVPHRQYMPRLMHTIHAFCFFVLWYLSFYPYPSRLLHCHWRSHIKTSDAPLNDICKWIICIRLNHH